jgi:16S rRNA (cytosine1402-N4)-methyltransferase
MMLATAHVPVLAGRAAELLRPAPGAVIVDATLGLGGHAELLLAAGATVVGLDRDPDALAASSARLAASSGERLVVRRASFAELAEVLDDLGIETVAGVLYDLGVSSLQLDTAERGFSYRFDAPLDMRMDPSTGPSAADVVNTWPVGELTRVLRTYGEERFASRIARFIDDARRRAPIATTGELVEVVKAAIPAATRRSGPHPARRTFQALRIEVNGELAALERSLPQAIDALAPGGRLVAIAYHSLEDRIVKRFIAGEPSLTPLARKPLRASEREIAANPRARSARLRAAERGVGVRGAQERGPEWTEGRT